jgi:hypothetical protein
MGDTLEFGKTEIEAFVGNKVWKQIVEDALSRGLEASENNDVLDPQTQGTTIARNQGEISALKWIVDLPRIFIEEIEERPKPKQVKEEEQEDE